MPTAPQAPSANVSGLVVWLGIGAIIILGLYYGSKVVDEIFYAMEGSWLWIVLGVMVVFILLALNANS